MKFKPVVQKLKKAHVFPIVFLCCSFALILVFARSPLSSFIICFLLFFFARLFGARLKVREGDVVLFWGLPGSGKTMMLAKTAYDNRANFLLACNEEIDHLKLPHLTFKREYWGWFSPPKGTLHLIDEASLNGWDCRDWNQNFTPESLEDWKKIRHGGAAAVLTNQGFSELDCKIRDSLCNCLYYCEDKGKYIRAVKMSKSVIFDPDTGKPVEGYEQPSLFKRFFDPSLVLYAAKRKYGRLYDTYNPTSRPPVLQAQMLAPIYAPGGRRRVVSWKLEPKSAATPGKETPGKQC